MNHIKVYQKTPRYHYYYFTPGEVFKPANAGGLSQVSEWQQSSSGLQDSSGYFSWSQNAVL